MCLKSRGPFGIRLEVEGQLFCLKPQTYRPLSYALVHRRGKGQNRNIPCPFNGNGYFSLVFGTIARDPSRDDLSSFCNEITKDPCILIVDLQFFVSAESTDFSPQERFLLSIGGRLFRRSPHILLLSL